MINETEKILKQLGERLREARLSRNESQEIFAQRLGITRQSLARMEQGYPQTPIGNWLAASSILEMLDGWGNVLAAQENLFAQFEREQSRRQRAGSRRNK
jgi:transcriptional regulator with XRE-family HTH domain